MVCISHSGRKRIYVIGGALAKDDGSRRVFSTVMDNWMYDVAAKTWARLQDSPIVSGNWPRALAYRNRYVLLVGGGSYDTSVTNNGPQVPVADASQHHPALLTDAAVGPPWQQRMLSFWAHSVGVGTREYSNGFLVYDTMESKFFWSDPLPIDTNAPGLALYGDELFIVGGETSAGCALGKAFGRHPDTVIRAELLLDSARVVKG